MSCSTHIVVAVFGQFGSIGSFLFQNCLTIVWPVFYHCVTGVWPVFYRCLIGVLPVSDRCFTGVWPVFYRCLTGVSRCLTGVSPVSDRWWRPLCSATRLAQEVQGLWDWRPARHWPRCPRPWHSRRENREWTAAADARYVTWTFTAQ